MTINRKFTENNFASVLDEYKYNANLGDIVAGTVFNIEENGLLVDIGTEIVGYLPKEEISLDMKLINRKTKSLNEIINTTRDFFLLAYNKHSKQLLLSIKRLEYIRAWKRIKQIEAEDIILNVSIKKINKGGVITQLEGIQGFIPKSHIGVMMQNPLQNGANIQCKLLLADEQNNKLILSHKKANLCITASKLKIGEIVEGTIIKVEEYGVFIKIYSVLSLLHISEIGYTNIHNINEIFKVGEIIKVKILHIDMEQGRLSVSRKNII
uniref:Small ribosomal subunit protein bS1c n=1 Tax=Caulacanthus okamurae TaxID=152008 RepID=A0A6H1U6V2_9FLOR|nr:30S ribosomal protein S1 [Caulacanthus okamurae]QIZ74612.1 30S ribosomal protein S1 [Caulacanthus okamurae]